MAWCFCDKTEIKTKKNMEESLAKKIEAAIKLLQSTCKNEVVELCYSGGKDSDVILKLAKLAGIKYRAIYRCTTIDPPGTIKHCIENNVEILRPKKSFLELIKDKGFPTRRARFCCDKLKEYKVLNKAIQGIRRCESYKRAKNYKEPTICRFYGSKKNHVEVILPILDFTDQDIKNFIIEYKIKLHPLYYNEDGTLNIKKRLGCMGCPLKSDNGLSDFQKHPKLVKAWLRAGLRWWNEKPHTASHKNFDSIYDLFISDIFFHSYEEFLLAKHGGFFKQDIDCKLFIEKYFNIQIEEK